MVATFKFWMKIALTVLVISLGLLWWASGSSTHTQSIGSVSTTYNPLAPNDKITIEAFDDPKVDGVACFVSRAEKGGWKGVAGVAEDPSEASIACRQYGPITIKGDLADGDEVFKKSMSAAWNFKTLQVVRFYDKKHNTLVYLTYSGKLIDGSPKNSLSAVSIQPWGLPAR